MKTKLFSLLVALSAISNLFAYSFKYGDLYYDITSGWEKTVAVTCESSGSDNYSGLTSVTIPATVAYNGTTYRVTGIGGNAFDDCTSLTSVTIPNSVTYLSGFDGCTGLTSITIPNSVTWIGIYAFRRCTSLTSITIPNSVTSIGENTFDGCTNLKSINLSDKLEVIKKGTFVNCTNLTSIVIPSSVKKIEGVSSEYDEGAFEGCTSLTSVTIPNSVTEIGEMTFSGCTGLTSINIPDSITSIAGRTFKSCTGLTSITIPNSVTSIEYSAFEGCTGLTSITIPNSVTSIGYSAFEGCTGLTSITIPNSVTSIAGSTFSGCTGLTSITIPNSVTSIGYSAFSGCTGLTSITIPNSVTSIGWGAFQDCTSLTSVTIPNSVTSIESSAFYGCTGLTDVTIGKSVTSIGGRAFASCNKLNHLIVLAPVPPEVEDYAFSSTYPQSVVVIKCYLDDYQSIKWGGFSSDKYNTYKLPVSVSSADTTLGYTKSLPVDSLMDCGDSLVVQAYPSSTAPFAFWSDGSIDNPHTIAIPDSGINLKAYFAKGLACGEAAQWQYADGVLSITDTGTMYDYAWDNVPWRLFRDSIQQVNIAEGITSIGACCLTGLSRLTNITLPNSITHIGDKALSGNDNLEVVVMGENIDTMGDSVFLNTPRVYQIVCKTQRVPTISENTFAEMSNRVPIYVLAACVNKYRVHEYWGRQNICSLSELTTYMVTATCDPQYGIVTGSGTYFEGESVTLTATPNSGYVFTRWSNGKTDNPYTFVAESNLTIEAQFISSTDVENVATMSDATPSKVLRNGQVLIIENGRLYNLLGQEVSL